MREGRTSSLYALTRALAAAKTEPEVVAAAQSHLTESFGARVDIDLDARGSGATSTPGEVRVDLHGSTGDLGVVALRRGAPPSDDTDEPIMLHAFAVPIAAALDRARIAEIARVARLRAETEQMRNALLSSVSHDLRTPLAVITGAATTLLDGKVDAKTSRELTEEIVLEAERLHRLVRNLLDMTRLEAGALEIAKDWQPLEEVVGTSLDRLSRVLEGRQVDLELDDDLGLVPFDSILIEQVLVNLLENAARYTPKDAPIRIATERRGAEVEIIVADRGPGVPAGDESRIFERFQRASKITGGTGLGLTICRGVVELHGGRIWAENAARGGAEFHFTLPIEGEPPPLSATDADPPAVAVTAVNQELSA
jgi:two-component system sensor histidine kinase KdpD